MKDKVLRRLPLRTYRPEPSYQNRPSIYLRLGRFSRKSREVPVIATVNTEPQELIAKTTPRPHLDDVAAGTGESPALPKVGPSR